MRSPPSSLLFTLMVTLMVLVVIVPFEALLGVVLEGYAAKRPRLEALGLGMNSNSWLGAVSVPGNRWVVTHCPDYSTHLYYLNIKHIHPRDPPATHN